MEKFIIRVTPYRGNVVQHTMKLASANAAIRYARMMAEDAARLEVWRNDEIVFMTEELGHSLPPRSLLQPSFA